MAYPSNRDDKRDWYRPVRRDPSLLPAALEFFEAEYKEALELATLEGRIIEAAKFHPGHMARFGFYAQQTKNLAAYFAHKLKNVRAEVMRDWDKNPPTTRKWGATEIKVMIESEPAIVGMEEVYQDVQYVADLWMDFATNFRDRSYQINNATRLITSDKAEYEFERDE